MEVTVCPHKDLVGCTSMSLNSTSSLALLAGRRSYGIVNLAMPDQLAYKETRQSKWEVICTEWSALEDRLVAVASNNKVELLTWTGSELVVDTSLRAHTRALTDMSWHTFDRNLLATSAADTFIYLWDMRDLRRPKLGLQAVAGAAKVQWNKVSGKYLASAHEGEVKLWDIRNCSSPVQYITAHLSRIYDLDWSCDQEDSLATSSQDSTVQFWNLASPSKAENVIKIPGAPVWRLQHTPVGCGLLTLVMHTLLRGENNLMLWNRQNLRAPVHTFYGHTDMVLDFGWVTVHGGRSQLVTWSKDCSMRVWDIDLELQRKCGLEVGEEELKIGDIEEEMEDGSFFQFERDNDDEECLGVMVEEEGAVIVSSPVNTVQSFQTGRETVEPQLKAESLASDFSGISKSKSMNLNYEFSLINVSDKLHVVAQDSRERLFTVSAETAKNVLILHVKFPLNYPNQKAPVFSFLQGTTVDNVTRSAILGKLRVVAKQQISRNRRCLEPCLRQFEASIEQLVQQEDDQIKLNNPQQLNNTAMLGGYQDNNIPYPRSSGARFCGDGNLVCFGCTRQYSVPVKMISASGEVGVMGDAAGGELDSEKVSAEIAKTPRALSAMTGVSTVSLLGSGATSPKYSVVGLSLCRSPSQDTSYFPYQARVPRVRFSTQKSRISVSSISSEDFNKPDRKSSTSSQRDPSKPHMGTVTIYSCSSLLPFSKDLASNYLVPGSRLSASHSLTDICSHNALMAKQADRPDLVQVWTLVSLSVTGFGESAGSSCPPWAMNPLGRSMIQDMIQHYVEQKDVQTAAVLCAVFGNKAMEVGGRVRKKNSKSESQRVDPACEVLNTMVKHNRSNSDTQEEHISSCQMRKLSLTNSEDDELSQMLEDSCMLDPKNNELYDSYILSYAEMLYRWKKFSARTELVKCLAIPSHMELFVANISISCQTCKQTVRGPRCIFCHSPSLRCSICRLPCSGLTCLCPRCGHGGHASHVRSWFSQHSQCPLGCGCHCLLG
eukprot:GFUD01017798.1.p1 GENE.GFUD01017798.1~~GFUD01017798.1.p1  ORF type:complete len:1001 (-),score=341.96 GFUD01017798.1:929-3931(-)